MTTTIATVVPNQCTAHRRSTGDRCRRSAMKGGNVCSTHGGRAPQVRRKAAERLAESADSVMAALIQIALNERVKTADRIMACRDLLDRAGYGAVKKIEIDAELDVDPALLGLVEDARNRARADHRQRPGLQGAESDADGMTVVDAELVADDDDPDGYMDLGFADDVPDGQL